MVYGEKILVGKFENQINAITDEVIYGLKAVTLGAFKTVVTLGALKTVVTLGAHRCMG